VTATEDTSEDRQGERIADVDALENKVAVAADAAATAAAHAVAAAKAAEEISKARDEAEAGAATQVDTGNAGREASSEATDPSTEPPENDPATKPDLVAVATDAKTKRSVPTDDDLATSDQTVDNLLNLDAPDVAMPTVLTRIALMALGAAAAIFVVSFLLVSALPKGTIFDIVILVTWLGVGALSLGGVALLAAAGVAKITRTADRA
jgi:hypothetical protein